MARHSLQRFETGRTIAGLLPALLRATPHCNAFGLTIRQEAAAAVALISATNITEASRRDVYAGARVIAALAPHAGVYGPAFDLYAQALTAFAYHSEYPEALALAQSAVDTGKKATKKAA